MRKARCDTTADKSYGLSERELDSKHNQLKLFLRGGGYRPPLAKTLFSTNNEPPGYVVIQRCEGRTNHAYN